MLRCSVVEFFKGARTMKNSTVRRKPALFFTLSTPKRPMMRLSCRAWGLWLVLMLGACTHMFENCRDEISSNAAASGGAVLPRRSGKSPRGGGPRKHTGRLFTRWPHNKRTGAGFAVLFPGGWAICMLVRKRKTSYGNGSRRAGSWAACSNLTGRGQTMLENIAPVAPKATLLALERTIAKTTDEEARGYGTHYIQLLGSLAYDVGLFDRCVALLVRLAVANDEKKDRSLVRHRLEILFHLYLSGTLAPVDQRLRVIEPLLASSDPTYRDIGVILVSAALEAWQFDSAGSFEFGARSRGYGYWPTTAANVQHWYCSVLQLIRVIVTGDGASVEPVRAALASAIRGLWTRTRAHAELDETCRAIGARQFWPDGWRAIRQVLRYDVKVLQS